VTGYEPLNIPKQVDDNIWVVDGEVIRFYGLPFTTRMTLVRLSNGDLLVHSPIALTTELKEHVEKLGAVRHLISPNWIHYAFISEWAQAFPNTIAWASPGVKERAGKYNSPVIFDRDLGEVAETEWSGEIEQMIVHGHMIHHEVVFFHNASKTLILTDLIENFEAGKISWWLRPLVWFAGILDPDGKAPVDMRLGFYKGKSELRVAVQKMIMWHPERIILAHGRWYQSNGLAELRRAFRWVLD